jgi:carboxylesterase
MSASYLLPTAEPFFLPGGKTGVVLIHGFTGTPKEMRWMGEYLNKKGLTVLGVRLFGHASDPDDMVRSRWWDWVTSVEDGLNLLKGCTTQQCVAGLSMGGILSLVVAAHYPVKCAVAISTPYTLSSDPRLKLIRILHYFYPRVPKGMPDFRNKDAEKDHVNYPYFPTRSIIQLQALSQEMKSGLSKIKVPVLLIQSHGDHGIPANSLDQIYENLGTKIKEKLWVEDSGHVIVREPEREKAFKATFDFISRCTGK